jgi:hypothetical protein
VSRRRGRIKRRTTVAAAVLGLIGWGWETHPAWTIAAGVLALAVVVAWLRERAQRRLRGRQGWIYHLPPHRGSALVYVGQTCWPERRMAQHQGLQGPASWFAGYVDFRRVEWYGPFPEADLDQIEADHIHTFEPWANKVRCEELRRPRLLRHETARVAA